VATAVPFEVVEAAVRVCGTAFHYKDQLKAMLIGAGVPEAVYRKWAVEGATKYAITRHVLNDLNSRPDGYAVVRRVVADLANMTKPDATAPDQNAGKNAILELKSLAVARRVLLDTDEAEHLRRRQEQHKRVNAGQARAEALEAVSARLVELTRSTENAQKRGYALERLLADLFAVFEIVYRPPYRVPHEQLDGAFEYKSFTYLVEARWRAVPPTFGDLADFKAKVDSKLESTRGVFLSMAGFDTAIVDHFAGAARGTRNNLLLVNGQDLALIAQGHLSLPDALDHKIQAASQEGRWWAALAARG
jgi:hypothetical protein